MSQTNPISTTDNNPAKATLFPKVPTRILRLPDVINRVGLKRASIYAAISQGAFPKQISLGARAVGWVEQEVDAWLEVRIQKSRNIAE